MSKPYTYKDYTLSTGDGYASSWDENPNDSWLTGCSYYRKGNLKPAVNDYGFTGNPNFGSNSMYDGGSTTINNFYPLGRNSFTIHLNSSAINKFKTWMNNKSQLIYFTSSEFSGTLPSSPGMNITNILVASRSTVTYKTYLRFEATQAGNAQYSAQCAANPVLRYGTDLLPTRKACFMMWFNTHAKPRGDCALYDVYTSLHCCQSKVINSCVYRNWSQFKSFVSASKLPWNYGYDMVCDVSEVLTNTWRIDSIDFSTGNATVSNAITINPACQVIIGSVIGLASHSYIMSTTISETYNYPRLINYKTDNFSVTEFNVNYNIPDTFIPSVQTPTLQFADNALYGVGRSFYNPGGVDSVPLSDSPGTYPLHLRRSGNNVYVSFKGLTAIIPYQPSIQIRILSHVSGNTYKGFTVNNLTEGFDHDIEITEVNSPSTLYDVSEFHSSLLDSINRGGVSQWIFNIGTVTVSGTFNTYIHNGSINIVASDITVTYYSATASAINFSFDVQVQNELNGTILVKTGFATESLAASASDSITLPTPIPNGVNLTMPISAIEYAKGNFVGRQALSVNQNSFGVSLEYDDVDDSVIDSDTDPYFSKYFGNN